MFADDLFALGERQAGNVQEQVARLPASANGGNLFGRVVVEAVVVGVDGALRDDGCGDATILPFLAKAGVSTQFYTGVDVSSRMIEKARKRCPQAHFVNMNFADGGDDVCTVLGGPFDCIIFNGSIQFFFDTENVM